MDAARCPEAGGWHNELTVDAGHGPYLLTACVPQGILPGLADPISESVLHIHMLTLPSQAGLLILGRIIRKLRSDLSKATREQPPMQTLKAVTPLEKGLHIHVDLPL